MIKAFKPLEAGFYALFVLFTVLFFEGNPLSVVPAVLLLLAKGGFETFYRADLDKMYGKSHHGAKEKLSILRVSVLLAIFSVLMAFYFGLALNYAFIILVVFLSSRIVHTFQFPSDLIIATTLPMLMMSHSGNLWSLSPVYWFIFFSEVLVRSTCQLNRPFGIESYNLPKLLGVSAAEDFLVILGLLSSLWPILMSRYAPGIAFIFFSFCAMVIAASVYAIKVSHLERAEKLTRVASGVFLLALYASYGLQIL